MIQVEDCNGMYVDLVELSEREDRDKSINRRCQYKDSLDGYHLLMDFSTPSFLIGDMSLKI